MAGFFHTVTQSKNILACHICFGFFIAVEYWSTYKTFKINIYHVQGSIPYSRGLDTNTYHFQSSSQIVWKSKGMLLIKRGGYLNVLLNGVSVPLEWWYHMIISNWKRGLSAKVTSLRRPWISINFTVVLCCCLRPLLDY